MTTTTAAIEVRCPADGRLVGTVPDQSRAEVAAAAARLREAQPAWEALGPDPRGAHLRDWRDWLLDNERRLGELVQSETGKSWADASMETALGVDIITYLTKHGAEFLAPRKVSPH